MGPCLSRVTVLPGILLGVLAAGCSEPRPLHVATTTSVEASGLLRRIVPAFEKRHGIRLRVVAVGTGQALRLLERGDVDAAITHDAEAEEALVRRNVARRRPTMANDFVLVGPPKDPAGVRGRSIEDAMRAIAGGGHPFVSRGDDSGTHRTERRLWQAAGVTDRGRGYREVGQGMGETLLMASELLAYTLTDTATFATFSRRLRLVPLVRGGARLRNPYSVLWRTPEGKRLADWLGSEEARRLMPPLFVPVP